jgi:hypothetical protein
MVSPQSCVRYRRENMRLVYIVVKTQPTTYCGALLGRTPDIDIWPTVLALALFQNQLEMYALPVRPDRRG